MQGKKVNSSQILWWNMWLPAIFCFRVCWEYRTGFIAILPMDDKLSPNIFLYHINSRKYLWYGSTISIEIKKIWYSFSLPWNQTATIFGWAAAILFCMMAAGMYFFHNAVFLSLFLSITIYHFALCEHLRLKLANLSEQISKFGNVHDLKILLKDWITFDISSKKCDRRFSSFCYLLIFRISLLLVCF